jgi:DNA topoisomerase-1
MVASQMSAAQYDNTTVDVAAKRNGDAYLLRKSSLVNTFPGFTALYSEGKDEEDTEKKELLPSLTKGEALKLRKLIPEQHFTQPPPRFTEATLIKTLERWGIGRPSTYAPTLSTIQDRDYVNRIKGSFQPTELGFVVNDLLVEYFSDIMSESFTAGLEEKLDDIASDKRDWVSVIRDFYTPLEKDLETATAQIERIKIPDELTDEACPKCEKPLAIKTGRFGKFLACTGYPECKFTKSFQIKTGAKCPECGGELVQRVSKKKRTFYGCSNYPECKFLINAKPRPEPCPKCGGLLTAGRGETARCTKCEFRGKVAKETT